MAHREALTFSCGCGQLQGTVERSGALPGTHIACHCSDCRAGVLYFGKPDPAPEPVHIYQTTPDCITITQGAEQLAAMTLSKSGPYRWYAKCCDTPMFNTLRRPTLAFSGVHLACVRNSDAVGKVQCESFIPKPGGGTKNRGLYGAAMLVICRLVAGRLSGRWRQTPFFDVTNRKPVSDPLKVDGETRARLYPG